MKTNTVKNVTFACAVTLGLGLSLLLPLAANAGDTVKGGGQLLKRSEAYFPAAVKSAENKADSKGCKSCCGKPVGCCSVKLASSSPVILN